MELQQAYGLIKAITPPSATTTVHFTMRKTEVVVVVKWRLFQVVSIALLVSNVLKRLPGFEAPAFPASSQ